MGPAALRSPHGFGSTDAGAATTVPGLSLGAAVPGAISVEALQSFAAHQFLPERERSQFLPIAGGRAVTKPT